MDTTYHFTLAPLQVALWAIPTAVCALVIHGLRSLLFDRQLAREMAREPQRDDTQAKAAADREQVGS